MGEATDAMMTVVRTILAFAIALSVALLPAAKSGVLMVSHADMATATDGMSTPDEMAMAAAMPDCCPKSNPADKSMDDCACMAGCLLTAFGLSSAPFADVVFALGTGSTIPLLATEAVRSQTGSPPFRPPRV